MTNLDEFKFCLYGLMLVCFLLAGGLDIWYGDVKSGVIAWSFAGINALLFFWRPTS